MLIMRAIIFSICALLLTANSFAQENLVQLSRKAGLYSDTIHLSVSGSADEYYYSTNGSSRKSSFSKYKKPIVIDRTTVVRIFPKINGEFIDTLVTATYILNFNTKFAIVSLSVEEEDLWDSIRGIYVPGVRGRFNDSTMFWESANFMCKWVRPAHFEFFDEKGIREIDQDAGLRIFGGTSRMYKDKSLRLVAGKEYGDKFFRYKFFEERDNSKYKDLVIRNSGNDYNKTRIADVLSNYLVKDLGFEHQMARPIQLFVNGKYWGCYNLREKINKRFFEYSVGANPDSLDLIQALTSVECGSIDRYQELRNTITMEDTKLPEVYEKIGQMMDVRNYINYRIAQIYLINVDERGNIRQWRSGDLGGRFRFVFYDTDQGFGNTNNFDYPYLEKCLSPRQTDWFNPQWSTVFLRKLLENEEFKRDFLVQSAHLLNVYFHPDTVIKKINYFESMYDPELPRNPSIMEKHHAEAIIPEYHWHLRIKKLRNFAAKRPDRLRSEIIRLIHPKGMYSLFVDANDTTLGQFKVNGNLPCKYPFHGFYFKDVPFMVEATVKNGYIFEGWDVNGDFIRSNTVIVDCLSDSMKIKGVYKLLQPGSHSKKVFINELSCSGNDWVELINKSRDTINLSGWALFDSLNTVRIPEGKYLYPDSCFLFARKHRQGKYMDTDTLNADCTFDFGLGRKKERIWLIDANNELVDSVGYTMADSLAGVKDYVYKRTFEPEIGLMVVIGVGTPGYEIAESSLFVEFMDKYGLLCIAGLVIFVFGLVLLTGRKQLKSGMTNPVLGVICKRKTLSILLILLCTLGSPVGLVSYIIYDNLILSNVEVPGQSPNNTLVRTDSVRDAVSSPVDNGAQYHIVIGSFRQKDNAKESINQKRKIGIQCNLIGPVKDNYYVVYKTFNGLEQAKEEYNAIKDSLDCWILTY